MAQKVGTDLWQEIQDSSSSGWIILDEGDEIPECTIVTTHHVIDRGDTGLDGRVWEQDWTKNEIKVRKKNGETSIMGLGGPKSPFLRTFIGKWKEHNLTPDTLVGTKWYINRISKWEYDIKYLGREDEAEASSSPQPFANIIKEDGSNSQLKKTIKELAQDPNLSKGISESDFLTVLAIKSSIPKKDISLTKLIADGLIHINVDGTIGFE